MKTFRLIAASFFFAALFAVSAFAQTTTAAGKVVFINTASFDDEKTGITKYVSAMNSLDTEFKPVGTELQTMVTRYQNLGKEIQTLQGQANASKVPVNQASIQAKIDEYGKLEREIKFKDEDIKAKIESRQQVILGPIMQDIGKALADFAKQKGYSMILDSAKLAQAGVVLAVGDEKADVTKEFITFYNARPAGTAAAK